MFLRHLVLVLTRGTVHNRDVIGFCPGTQTAAETSCHTYQVSVVQVFIGTV